MTPGPRPTPQLRPALHFTARRSWLNDPNGPILHKGLYHLFFQNNPLGRDCANIAWGHAISPDLHTWQELPTAIAGTTNEQVFSGSVVWDRDNTSGLGDGPEGPLIAIYTSAYAPQHPVRPGEQAQSLAFSTDEGRTWQKHPGNPILARGSESFRDPKVFWHAQTGRWVLAAVEAIQRRILIYTATNLMDWQLASSFGPIGRPGPVWECPDLFEVPCAGQGGSAWVLLWSTNPGGFSGGSGVHYLTGAFDGRVFTPGPAAPHWLDAGPDMYAATTFQGTDQPTLIGWLSNWSYAKHAPTHPWRSAMTLPRTLNLVHTAAGLRLQQALILPGRLPPDVLVHDFEFSGPGSIELVMGDSPDADRIAITRTPTSQLVADRSAADPWRIHRRLPATAPIPLTTGRLAGRLVFDHGLLELCCPDDRLTITMQTFPRSTAARLVTTGAVRITD